MTVLVILARTVEPVLILSIRINVSALMVILEITVKRTTMTARTHPVPMMESVQMVLMTSPVLVPLGLPAKTALQKSTNVTQILVSMADFVLMAIIRLPVGVYPAILVNIVRSYLMAPQILNIMNCKVFQPAVITQPIMRLLEHLVLLFLLQPYLQLLQYTA